MTALPWSAAMITPDEDFDGAPLLRKEFALVEPGYTKILFAPRPGPGIDWAKTSLATPRGTVASEWHLAPEGEPILTVTVPDGVTAEVDLPSTPRRTVEAGTHTLTTAGLVLAGEPK